MESNPLRLGIQAKLICANEVLHCVDSVSCLVWTLWNKEHRRTVLQVELVSQSIFIRAKASHTSVTSNSVRDLLQCHYIQVRSDKSDPGGKKAGGAGLLVSLETFWS